jgi:hypothetical protein
MSRNYKFHKPESAYFVSFAVIEWLYVFRPEDYKYSSALDYAGGVGLIDDLVVVR